MFENLMKRKKKKVIKHKQYRSKSVKGAVRTRVNVWILPEDKIIIAKAARKRKLSMAAYLVKCGTYGERKN